MNIAKLSASLTLKDVVVGSLLGAARGLSGTVLSSVGAAFGFFCFLAASFAKGRKKGLSGGVDVAFVAFFAFFGPDRAGCALLLMRQNFT